jgi:hypothetical protein
MSVNTFINDISLRELWIHMLERVCFLKDTYLHPFYNFDTGKAIGYFYRETKEIQISIGRKYKLLPPSDSRTKSIIFFLINGLLRECLYDARAKKLLCVFQAGLVQENINELFEIPQGIEIEKIRSFDESVTGIPSRLYLLAKFIDVLEGNRSSQRSIVDTLRILNPIFMKSLDLAEVYRQMKRKKTVML